MTLTTKRKPYQDPRLAEGPTQPLVAGSASWQPLGTIGNREFGTVSGMAGFERREFELVEEGPVVQLDGGSFYLDFNEYEPWRVVEDERGQEQVETIAKFRRVAPWPLGTFEKLTRPKAAAKAKDALPVDALTGLPWFLRGRAPTRDNILALLAREGVTVAHGPSGEILVSTRGGRWPKDAVVDVLRRPGMAAYLQGNVSCAWPHDGEAPAAMTLDILGNGLCSAPAHRVKPATGIVGKLRAAVGLT